MSTHRWGSSWGPHSLRPSVWTARRDGGRATVNFKVAARIGIGARVRLLFEGLTQEEWVQLSRACKPCAGQDASDGGWPSLRLAAVLASLGVRVRPSGPFTVARLQDDELRQLAPLHALSPADVHVALMMYGELPPAYLQRCLDHVRGRLPGRLEPQVMGTHLLFRPADSQVGYPAPIPGALHDHTPRLVRALATKVGTEARQDYLAFLDAYFQAFDFIDIDIESDGAIVGRRPAQE